MNKRNKLLALSLLSLAALIPHQTKPVNYSKLLSNWIHVTTVVGVPLYVAAYFSGWLPEETEDGDFDYHIKTEENDNDQENEVKISVQPLTLIKNLDEMQNEITVTTLWVLPTHETSDHIIIKSLCFNIKNMNSLDDNDYDSVQRKAELLDDCLFLVKNIQHDEESTKRILLYTYNNKKITTHLLESYEALGNKKIELKNN